MHEIYDIGNTTSDNNIIIITRNILVVYRKLERMQAVRKIQGPSNSVGNLIVSGFLKLVHQMRSLEA